MFTPTSFRPTSRNLDGVSWHAMTTQKKSRISAGSLIVWDDVTVRDILPKFTFAQIMEFINKANENHCANVLAVLLEYRNTSYADFDPMTEFTLE